MPMRDFLGKMLTKSFFDNPLVVVGAGRSGTSVLLQALGQHPLILSMPGEAPFITTTAGGAYLLEYAENTRYYEQSIKVSKEYLFDVLRRLSFEVAAGRHYGLKIVLNCIRGGDLYLLRKRYWCVKTFPGPDTSKGLLKLYGKAKFIYIIRNGCDVVQSMSKFSGFCQQSFEKNCKDWTDSVKKYRYLLDHESSIVIHHERLIEKPAEVFSSIFAFIGIGYHDKPAHFIQSTLVHPLNKPTQKGVDVKGILSKRKLSYEDWSLEQREAFKEICGSAMKEVGYEVHF